MFGIYTFYTHICFASSVLSSFDYRMPILVSSLVQVVYIISFINLCDIIPNACMPVFHDKKSALGQLLSLKLLRKH